MLYFLFTDKVLTPVHLSTISIVTADFDINRQVVVVKQSKVVD